MKLLESYSLTAGQKIGKIHTAEKFYPLPFNDFILIQGFSKPSKCYSYWNTVIEILKPILDKNNITLLQVGGKDEPKLNHCFQTQGQTNWGQLEYLVSHAKLVLCTDSISSHLAGHYNIPLVVLTSNNFSECVSPFFGEKSKQIILEPNRAIQNPLFALDEGPKKQIDEIPPEKIAQSVCQLLNLDFHYNYQTVRAGEFYNHKLIEMVPDCNIDISKVGITSIIVRMDFLFDETVLEKQLQISPCSITTNRPISKEILEKYRARIPEIIYILDDNHSIEFVNLLEKMAFNYHLATYQDGPKLNDLKLAYLDYRLIHTKNIFNPRSDNLLKNMVDWNKVYYQSGKNLLSKGRVYPSKAAWLRNLPINSLQEEKQVVINHPDFWLETENFYLWREIA